MYVLVSTDDNGAVDYVGKGAGVAPTINFDDEEFGKEVFEKFIEKYESLGYEITRDDSAQGVRLVELKNDSEKHRITFDGSNIVLNIPLTARDT